MFNRNHENQSTLGTNRKDGCNLMKKDSNSLPLEDAFKIRIFENRKTVEGKNENIKFAVCALIVALLDRYM